MLQNTHLSSDVSNEPPSFFAVSSWRHKLEISGSEWNTGVAEDVSDLRKCVVQAISFALYSRGTAYMEPSGSEAAINILWLDVLLSIFNKPATKMSIVLP